MSIVPEYPFPGFRPDSSNHLRKGIEKWTCRGGLFGPIGRTIGINKIRYSTSIGHSCASPGIEFVVDHGVLIEVTGPYGKPVRQSDMDYWHLEVGSCIHFFSDPLQVSIHDKETFINNDSLIKERDLHPISECVSSVMFRVPGGGYTWLDKVVGKFSDINPLHL